jgi:ATP-dependent DNA helicase RecQ
VNIPGSLEAYYQEIGRAGRDGRRATATLLWNPEDVATREFLIDAPREPKPGRPKVDVDPAEVERRRLLDHQKLHRMVGYAEAAGCLRATILRYFGDPATREPCGSCGNCDHRMTLDDGDRLLVRKILSGIARAGERFGRRRIAAMLVGDLEDLPASLTSLSTTGLLKDEDAHTIARWIDAARESGLLVASDDQYRILSLTPLGRDVMTGRVDDVRMVSAPHEGQATRPGWRRRMAWAPPPIRSRRWR